LIAPVRDDKKERPRYEGRSGRWRWMLIVALAIGIALRMIQFRQIPPGLYRDEAYHGIDALTTLQGDIRVFYDTNFGREGLFIWLTALSVWFWGASPLAVRFPSLIIGILTLFTCYGMTKELYGRRIATLATSVFAVTLWHIHFSRVGFRAILIPLFTSLSVWMVARGVRTSKNWFLGLGGVAAGALIYTYIAARAAILPTMLFVGYVWLRRRSPKIPSLQQWLCFTLPALAIMSPFLLFTARHWEDIFLRTQIAVGVFTVSNPGQLLLRNISNTLSMFTFQGDFVSRHNVPLRPVFDPALGTMFYLGLWLACRRFKQEYATAFLLLWILAMLLPSLLTEDCPHFIRMMGILPFIAIFPAIGLDWCWEQLVKRGKPYWSATFVGVILVVGLGSTTWHYFIRYPTMTDIRHAFEFDSIEQPAAAPGAYRKLDWSKNAWRTLEHPASQPGICYRFECAGVELAHDINAYLETGWTKDAWRVSPTPGRADRQVFVQFQLWKDVVNAHFLIPDSPGFNVPGAGEIDSVTPNPNLPTLFYGWYNQYYPEFWKSDLLAWLPPQALIEVYEGPWATTHQDPSPHPAYLKFVATPTEVPGELLAGLEPGIGLVDSCTIPGDGLVTLQLHWYSREAIDVDYTVFVHYERDGQIITQADGPPAMGYYPTSDWRRHDQILDRRWLDVPERLEGDRVWVGMYVWQTGQRLPVSGARVPVEGNRILANTQPCIQERKKSP